MPPRIDYTGRRFGFLVATMGIRWGRDTRWAFLCDCGKQKVARVADVASGKTRSCGCKTTAMAVAAKGSHGEGGARYSSEYSTWKGMIQRCTDPAHSGWHNYGGRGISVCERWRASFAMFLGDMGRRPTPAHTLERIENDSGYFPGNVRWATRKEQAANSRRWPKSCQAGPP